MAEKEIEKEAQFLREQRRLMHSPDKWVSLAACEAVLNYCAEMRGRKLRIVEDDSDDRGTVSRRR